MTNQEHYEQLELKIKFIEYLIQSDTRLSNKLDFSHPCIVLEKTNNKDAKKYEQNTYETIFSKSLLDICTEFYDGISQHLEESQTFLDRLDTEEITPEMMRLQFAYQLKSLQNSSAQFLLNLERYLQN